MDALKRLLLLPEVVSAALTLILTVLLKAGVLTQDTFNLLLGTLATLYTGHTAKTAATNVGLPPPAAPAPTGTASLHPGQTCEQAGHQGCTKGGA